ncbi:hypothetical protein NIES4071_34080 [Calothrix sp. NIES-4071]|nr:hypothetical protein NIES4071_34080 [Calothrix sp. NIES-4071]BAZ57727.1 hypothetical protein NIES4105_34010 [Calothrix sp. NIES-4105]
MKTLIVLFNLKDEQSVEEYERWAKEKDTPAIKQLQSVEDKRVYRAMGLMGANTASPYQYIEVIDVNDLNQLSVDTNTDEIQQLIHYFQQITKDLTFIVTEQFS